MNPNAQRVRSMHCRAGLMRIQAVSKHKSDWLILIVLRWLLWMCPCLGSQRDTAQSSGTDLCTSWKVASHAYQFKWDLGSDAAVESSKVDPSALQTFPSNRWGWGCLCCTWPFTTSTKEWYMLHMHVLHYAISSWSGSKNGHWTSPSITAMQIMACRRCDAATFETVDQRDHLRVMRADLVFNTWGAQPQLLPRIAWLSAISLVMPVYIFADLLKVLSTCYWLDELHSSSTPLCLAS